MISIYTKRRNKCRVGGVSTPFRFCKYDIIKLNHHRDVIFTLHSITASIHIIVYVWYVMEIRPFVDRVFSWIYLSMAWLLMLCLLALSVDYRPRYWSYRKNELLLYVRVYFSDIHCPRVINGCKWKQMIYSQRLGLERRDCNLQDINRCDSTWWFHLHLNQKFPASISHLLTWVL